MFLSIAFALNFNHFNRKNWTGLDIRKICADNVTQKDFDYAKNESIYTIEEDNGDTYSFEFDINEVKTLEEFKEHIKIEGNHYWGDDFLLSIVSRALKIHKL